MVPWCIYRRNCCGCSHSYRNRGNTVFGRLNCPRGRIWTSKRGPLSVKFSSYWLLLLGLREAQPYTTGRKGITVSENTDSDFVTKDGSGAGKPPLGVFCEGAYLETPCFPNSGAEMLAPGTSFGSRYGVCYKIRNYGSRWLSAYIHTIWAATFIDRIRHHNVSTSQAEVPMTICSRSHAFEIRVFDAVRAANWIGAGHRGEPP